MTPYKVVIHKMFYKEIQAVLIQISTLLPLLAFPECFLQHDKRVNSSSELTTYSGEIIQLTDIECLG